MGDFKCGVATGQFQKKVDVPSLQRHRTIAQLRASLMGNVADDTMVAGGRDVSIMNSDVAQCFKTLITGNAKLLDNLEAKEGGILTIIHDLQKPENNKDNRLELITRDEIAAYFGNDTPAIEATALAINSYIDILTYIQVQGTPAPVVSAPPASPTALPIVATGNTAEGNRLRPSGKPAEEDDGFFSDVADFLWNKRTTGEKVLEGLIVAGLVYVGLRSRGGRVETPRGGHPGEGPRGSGETPPPPPGAGVGGAAARVGGGRRVFTWGRRPAPDAAPAARPTKPAAAPAGEAAPRPAAAEPAAPAAVEAAPKPAAGEAPVAKPRNISAELAQLTRRINAKQGEIDVKAAEVTTKGQEIEVAEAGYKAKDAKFKNSKDGRLARENIGKLKAEKVALEGEQSALEAAKAELEAQRAALKKN